MTYVAVKPHLIISRPSPPLRDFVSHYWLNLDNRDSAHAIVPDGAVDLVISQSRLAARGWVYGTSTCRTEAPLEQHNHYLGVRFKPGRSRHFIDAAAHELTDRCEPAEGLLLFSLDNVLEQVADTDVFAHLDRLLEGHLLQRRPASTRIDEVIALIESSRGTARIAEAAAAFGKSRRQLERVFLETVGVSPKFFASITRFQHAVALIQRPSASLADIALQSGYADQSHMSHEFKRFIDRAPAMVARGAVAFLQDLP